MASGIDPTYWKRYRALKNDLFQCTICFNEYDQSEHKAKLLPCTHTFCKQCLAKIVKVDLLKCPICSIVSSVTNVDALQNNHYLAQFTDVLQSISAVNLDNPGSSLPDTDKFCRKHGNTEKFFWCKTCKVSVCIHCMGLDHKPEMGHEVCDVSRATNELRRHVLNTLNVVSGKIRRIKRKKKESQELDCSVAQRAMDVILNYTSDSTKAITDFVSDSALNPNDFNSKFDNPSRDFRSEDIYSLSKAYKELKELLDYFGAMESFIDQKFLEAVNVQKESIVLSILRKDTCKLVQEKMHCIGCGEMYPSREVIAPATVRYLCSKCDIAILLIS